MDLKFLLLLFLFGGLVGFFLANLIQSLRSGGDDPAGAQPEAPKQPASLQDAEEIEVARLIRRTGKTGLIVEMDSRRYQAPVELDAKQRNRLALAMDDLEAWVGPLPQPAPAPASPPALTAPQAPLTFQPGSAPASRPISLNPLEIFVPGSQHKADTRLKSLAEQIDEVLQEQLKNNPFAYPEIRLMDSPSKGLLVQIGGERYEGIDAVPTEELRGVIKGAVKEWERRTSLKR
jgi:hypothetical protein